MDLIKWFRPTKPKTEARAIGVNQFGNPINVGDTAPLAAGVHVNEQTALTLSTVYRAARVISEAVGGLPLKVYRKTSDGREEAKEHPLWPVVRFDANPNDSTGEFLALLQFWAVLFNNAFAEIVRNGAGEVVELHPIHPGIVEVSYDDAGRRVFDVLPEGGKRVRLPASDVIHLRGPSLDGSAGCRLVQLARESIGFTVATERHGSSYFGNGATLGGVLEYAGELTDQAREVLRASFKKAHVGPENAYKWALLENGVSAKPFTTNNEQSQYVEVRNHQVYEVCRWVGIDPIFLYEYGRATWDNAEAQTRNFLQFSLNPWLIKWESEFNRKCIGTDEREEVYAEFTRQALIELDTKTQHEVWATGLDKGFYTVEEVRQWLNLPKLPEPQQVNPQQVNQPGDNGTQKLSQ